MQPPVAADEAACASSYLWWQQRLAGSSTMWELVKEAHSHIATQMQAQGGLMFWQRVQADVYSPPYTVGPGLDHEGNFVDGHLPLCCTLHSPGPLAEGRLQLLRTTHCMADLLTPTLSRLGVQAAACFWEAQCASCSSVRSMSPPRMRSSCLLRLSSRAVTSSCHHQAIVCSFLHITASFAATIEPSV